MIKITLIVGLIVTAVVMLFLGFNYPATHIEGVDGTVSGATVSLTNITDGFQLAPNGWMNFFMSFQMVFFAYQLIEFVGVTVSETQNPRKVLPKAVNELIMRILIFYVGALSPSWLLCRGATSTRTRTARSAPRSSWCSNMRALTGLPRSCSSW